MSMEDKYLKYKNKYISIKDNYNRILDENKNLKIKYLELQKSTETLTEQTKTGTEKGKKIETETRTETRTKTETGTSTGTEKKPIEKTVNFILNKNAGFFSVFFFLVQSYIYAKKTNKTFCVNSDDWTYKYSNGWTDYFDTNYDCKNKELDKNQIEIFSHANMPSVPNYSLNDYIAAIKEIYKLKSSLIEKANKIINTLGNYKAVYIRRGDKIAASEAKIISISDIIQKIKIDKDEKLFVQTDDYSVVKEIKRILPTVEIISTVPENKFGSYHHSMWVEVDKNKNKNPNINKIETILDKDSLKIKEDCEELLIGVYICTNAKECWVDKTSNVSRFIKLYSPDTVHIYPVDIKLDYNKTTHCPAYQESFE